MRGVYKKIGIKAAKLRIYIRKHPQPPSYNRFKCEHLQPVASDIESRPARQFSSRFGSDTGHALGQFTSTQPGEQSNGGNEKRAQRQGELFALALPYQDA